MQQIKTGYEPIAEVIRGDKTESVHYGAIAVTDNQGKLVWEHGDSQAQSFVRSSAKPFQCIAALTTGLHGALELNQRHLAIMCASHGAESIHLTLIEDLLKRADVCEDQFTLGPHEPLNDSAAWSLCSQGKKPTKIHNNCSGKHAGMLAACRVMGWPIDSYFERDHPLQARIFAVMSAFTGRPLSELYCAVDGCGVPSFYLNLVQSATAFARLGQANPELSQYEIYRQQVVQAMCAHPELVAKTDSWSLEVVRAAEGGIVAKSGAEGVFCFALANQGLGVSIKIADGEARAIPLIVNAMVRQFDKKLALSNKVFAGETRAIYNTKDEQVGKIKLLI